MILKRRKISVRERERELQGRSGAALLRLMHFLAFFVGENCVAPK